MQGILNCIHFSGRFLRNKVAELFGPNGLTIYVTESWLHSDISDCLQLSGTPCTVYRKDNGGVAVFY